MNVNNVRMKVEVKTRKKEFSSGAGWGDGQKQRSIAGYPL